MTDPALDMSTDALYAPTATVEKPTDPWLVRRKHSFGGSDLAALFVLLGLRESSSVPGYIADAAKVMRKSGRLGPRLILEKAGFAKPYAGNESMRIGSAREPELLAAWTSTLATSMVDTTTVVPASAVPRECYPWVDRECPRLAVTPDAWCRDVWSSLLTVELKCSRYYESALPWYWRVQAMSQIAVMGASGGFVVLGRGWSRAEDYMGEVTHWEIERNESEIDEIRDAVVKGWEMVERLREMT